MKNQLSQQLTTCIYVMYTITLDGHVHGGDDSQRQKTHSVNWGINLLATNDAYMCHDPCELSISLWEFIWSIKYWALYFSTGIVLVLAVSYGG